MLQWPQKSVHMGHPTATMTPEISPYGTSYCYSDPRYQSIWDILVLQHTPPWQLDKTTKKHRHQSCLALFPVPCSSSSVMWYLGQNCHTVHSTKATKKVTQNTAMCLGRGFEMVSQSNFTQISTSVIIMVEHTQACWPNLLTLLQIEQHTAWHEIFPRKKICCKNLLRH